MKIYVMPQDEVNGENEGEDNREKEKEIEKRRGDSSLGDVTKAKLIVECVDGVSDDSTSSHP